MASIALDAAVDGPPPAGEPPEAEGAAASTSSSDPATTTTAPTTTSTPTTAATTTTTIPSNWLEVPDVVGLDHQLAQDTMQFAGLRNLAEVDASGDGRRLIWDRNWIVVEQSPAAGLIVDPDTEILLSSLKDDETG